MIPNPIDFIMVVSNDDDYQTGFHHFADKVNRKLKAGYELHGQPFGVGQVMCQAMTRPEGMVGSSDDTTMYYKKLDSGCIVASS